MHIVTDSGMNLVPQMRQGLDLHIVPHTISLAGQVYRSEVDIDSSTFYQLLEETGEFPSTSLPSPGDFGQVYRQLAASDPEILSIHMSSGLSGTVVAARAGVEMVPEAQITIVDTKTLSAVQGWLAARTYSGAVAAHRPGQREHLYSQRPKVLDTRWPDQPHEGPHRCYVAPQAAHRRGKARRYLCATGH